MEIGETERNETSLKSLIEIEVPNRESAELLRVADKIIRIVQNIILKDLVIVCSVFASYAN